MRNSPERAYGGTVQSIGRRNVRELVLPFPWGDGILLGGPYHERPEECPGIKLATEIDRPCTFSLPIHDFSVPNEHDTRKVLLLTITMLHCGYTPYVGCMGGKGRTGLFLALLAKVALNSNRPRWQWWRKADDPVAYVRKHYRPEAVETSEQEQFVRQFNTVQLERWARALF